METEPEPGSAAASPRATGLLLVIGAATLVLTAVFGVSVLRNRASYRAYRAETLENAAVPLPWTSEDVSVEGCIAFAVEWGMACPGLESWCANEAPQVARRCFESRDRSRYCREVGSAIASTSFGFHECKALRASVTGTHAQRSHKKFCAAAYRTLAAVCMEDARDPAPVPASGLGIDR